MLTRREALMAAGCAVTAAAVLDPRTAWSKASQPGTPVSFEMPDNACDCHTHIIGDPQQFPFVTPRVYTPETAFPDEMSALHQALRIKRVVIVTPSFYGSDKSASLMGMKALGRPYFVAPEVTKYRSEALRSAFMQTMAEPEFLAVIE